LIELKENNKYAYLLSQTPDPDMVEKNQREVLYIGGQSGSGKTTYASQYLENYIDTFPDNKIFLFSGVDEDPILDQYNPIRIPLDEDFLEIQTKSPLDERYKDDDFMDSLVIFDDIDDLPDKRISREVLLLRDGLLTRGRHTNTCMIVIRHEICEGVKTTKLFNEANFTIVYKSFANLEYILNKKLKLNKKNTYMALNIGSRWLCIAKTVPPYIIYQNGVKLLLN